MLTRSRSNTQSQSRFQESVTISPGVGTHNIPRYLDNSTKIQKSDMFHASSSNNMTSSFKNSGRSKILMNDATLYCTTPEYEEDYILQPSGSSNQLFESNSFVNSNPSVISSTRSLSLGGRQAHTKGAKYDKPWILDEKLRYYGRVKPRGDDEPSEEELHSEINTIRNLPGY